MADQMLEFHDMEEYLSYMSHDLFFADTKLPTKSSDFAVPEISKYPIEELKIIL
jgi:hypothetical protein